MPILFFWKTIQDTINNGYLWKEDYFYKEKNEMLASSCKWKKVTKWKNSV